MIVRGALTWNKFFTIVAFCIFAITFVRMAVVVLAEPMIGFANNFDFARQSACVGLWENYGDRPKLRGHPDAPVPRLVFDGDRSAALCRPSVDNIFPYLAAHAHRKHEAVDLREVGAWKAVFAMTAFAVILLQSMPAYARAALAVTLGLTLGDMDTLSYANTLYLEYSVIVSGILALAAVSCLVGQAKPVSWGGSLVAAAALAWLALSKQQYGVFAVCLAGFATWVLIRKWKHAAQGAILIACSVAAAVVFAEINAGPAGSMNAADAANATDTFLGAVLPGAGKPQQALASLGLPQSCLSGIGETWYTPGLQAHHPCPAALHLSRARLVPLFISQPTTFTIPVAHAISLTQSAAATDPQRFERRSDENAWLVQLLLAVSPSQILARLPPTAYRVAVAVAMAMSVVLTPALLMLSVKRVVGSPVHAMYGMSMATLGSVAVAYTVLSTVFGDGYQDAHRHAALLPAAMTFFSVGCVCWLYEAKGKHVLF